MRTICLRGAVLLVAWAIRPAAAAAEPPAARPWHGGLGAGGYTALLGPEATGVTAEAELYPGGAFGRWGGRMEARSLDDASDGVDAGLVSAGVTYEAAASRPRLALALHGDAGVVLPDARAAVGGGVHTQLWVIGPLALGFDSTAFFVLDGLDSELLLAGSLTLRIAR